MNNKTKCFLFTGILALFIIPFTVMGYAEESDQCLDIRRSNAVMRDCVLNENSQLWSLDEESRIVNSNGKCLDIAGENSNNLANIIVWNCHNNDNQKWIIMEDGLIQSAIEIKHVELKTIQIPDSPEYEIIEVVTITHRCLDVKDGNIQIGECYESNTSKWTLDSTESTTFQVN